MHRIIKVLYDTPLQYRCVQRQSCHPPSTSWTHLWLRSKHRDNEVREAVDYLDTLQLVYALGVYIDHAESLNYPLYSVQRPRAGCVQGWQ